MKMFLGEYNSIVENVAADLNEKKIVSRIWQKDHTVWKDDPEEISNRLGWLDCIEVTKKSFDEINSFVEEIRGEGFTNALLMGMGGSSLAPEVFRLTLGISDDYLDLSVLDSTHPEQILEFSKKLNPEKTLYIVSTKSGGTIETISFMKYFYTETVKKLGRENAGKHFIAITDTGSGLEAMAKELNFNKIFLNDPNIGGRFSALSLFGIVPTALIGVDIEKLLSEAEKIVEESKIVDVRKNNSSMLGVIMGALANRGIDKFTFLISPQLKFMGAWLEQLIAESTGKDGNGILPVDLEPDLTIDEYSNDRVFIYIKLNDDSTFKKKITELKKSAFPVIEIELEKIYNLGGEFLRWEFATAVAGYVMGVQPFDQPNVESAKVAARKMMEQFAESGSLQSIEPALVDSEIKVYGDIKSTNLKDALEEFLSSCKKGKSYIALQAYLKPEEETWNALQEFRTNILSKYKVATTLGFGPRFLHSTGQLHKGDGGNGLFIQFIDEPLDDVPIPKTAGEKKSSISFGTLIKAQALGDRQALIDSGRKVIRIDVGTSIPDNITKLVNFI
ncbi:MAG: glucose-6-phosphate isomerase [Ignavibacteria bacterium]|nr:glucose-6-phosphate isomerase [Ignavibacteria bacterium]MBT8390264.1 glucose-6-phosphate isomerase [Ignavibacteria bacterium]NNJ53196.1 glucose-6-phosphate isomerase [Ignavibacteriaceae bacterium]